MKNKPKKKNIEYDIEIERKEAQNPNLNKYDYIYPLDHITSPDEQKIKAEEIDNITKIKKDTGK